MTISLRDLGIDKLDADQRLALIEQLWDTFPVDSTDVPLTDAQRTELDRRCADHDSHPNDVIPLTEVEKSIRQRLDQ